MKIQTIIRDEEDNDRIATVRDPFVIGSFRKLDGEWVVAVTGYQHPESGFPCTIVKANGGTVEATLGKELATTPQRGQANPTRLFRMESGYPEGYSADEMTHNEAADLLDAIAATNR